MLQIRQGGGYDAHWSQVANVIAPRRYRVLTSDQNRGDRKHNYIVDSTGVYAKQTLQSGFHAGMTPPSRPWFSLSTPDPELAEFGPVKQWLYTVTSRMRTVFSRCNLYRALPTVYGDFSTFGTAAMSVLEDEVDLMRCYTYPVGSYSLALDDRGLVSTFTHEYELTVRQLVKRFGVTPGTTDIEWKNISDRVKNLWDRGQYEETVKVTWLIQPNDDRRAYSPFAKDKKFRSCHWETDTRGKAGEEDKFLRESGFDEFPVMGLRWETTSTYDIYGQDCPGMTALGDIRQLMAMTKDKGRLVKKAVDPPLKAPSSLRTQKPSLLPGDVTYLDTRQGQDSIAPIHEVRLEGYQYLREDIADIRYMIQRAYREDLFLMMATSDQRMGADRPTAREVAERHEEKLIALGPTLEQTNDDLLNKLIDRAFAIMDRAGMLPEPPAELSGVTLKVEYESILASAQKLIGAASLDRFVASTLPLSEVWPIVKHKVRGEQIVDNYADALTIDPRLIVPDEEAQQLLAKEQQQQAALAEAEQAQKYAAAMATAGKAPIAPDSALDRVVSGLAG